MEDNMKTPLPENKDLPKEKYESPTIESHNPLEIMSAWVDRSSDLQF